MLFCDQDPSKASIDKFIAGAQIETPKLDYAENLEKSEDSSWASVSDHRAL